MNANNVVASQDLVKLSWVSDPQVSPDGQEVAYVITTVDQKEYQSHILISSLHKQSLDPLPITLGEKDQSPKWSPDAKQIAFLRRLDGVRQLFVIPRFGGEARSITTTKKGVGSFIWSPDGSHIAFTSRIHSETSFDDKLPEEEEKYYSEHARVVDRLKYKADGEGLWDGRRSQLFVLKMSDLSVTQLTQGDFDVMEPVWAPNGQTISFIAKKPENSEADPDLIFTSDIFTVFIEGGELTRVTDSSLAIMQFEFSLDGDKIAFFGHDRSFASATQTKIYLAKSDGSESPICITPDFDKQIGDVGMSDMRSHLHTPAPIFSADGKFIFALVSEGGNTHVGRFMAPASGSPTVTNYEQVTQGDREVYQFDMTSDRNSLILAATNTVSPGDLYLWDVQSAEERRMTTTNDEWLDSVELSVPEAFSFIASDGVEVHGWMMRPVGFVEGQKYPTVLEIHGGPHAMYSNSFFLEFQLLTAQGFAVFYTNPRGSYGYGQTFVDACRGDYGGRDYQDLMEATDYVTSKYDFVDSNQLGVTGGSYGGFMTNWIVGHTDRFQAGVTQRSISNWLSFYGVSDIGYHFTPWEIDGEPWTDLQKLWHHSPIAYVEQVNTPLLILHGEQDLRCPIEQGEQLFVALKRLGKKTRLVRFPGASHDLSRNGKPELRIERYDQIVGWFVDHISKGGPVVG